MANSVSTHFDESCGNHLYSVVYIDIGLRTDQYLNLALSDLCFVVLMKLIIYNFMKIQTSQHRSQKAPKITGPQGANGLEAIKYVCTCKDDSHVHLHHSNKYNHVASCSVDKISGHI